MSASLHLAGPDDLPQLLPMVAAFHEGENIDSTEEKRAAALQPLLDGAPHGAVWLIGPVRAPLGYIAISFGWSIEYGGLDAVVDELFIRPRVRGRGIASEALALMGKTLGAAGVKALHLEVHDENATAIRLYSRAHFARRAGYGLMSRELG